MSEILKFSGDHPFLTFGIALLVFKLAVWPFRLVNRWFRHLNIKSAGWPPAHIDADGDAIKEEQ